MDYKKLLPVLALTLGISAGAAESFAVEPAALPSDHNNINASTLFQANEVNASGVLLARDKGCMAQRGCFGVCAGKKDRHKSQGGSGSSSTSGSGSSSSGSTSTGK